jgi:hypothetical protein
MKNTLSLQLPSSLHEQVCILAERENVSVNQLVMLALSEKVSALMTQEYLAERAERGSRENFENALAKVADTDPEECDRI